MEEGWRIKEEGGRMEIHNMGQKRTDGVLILNRFAINSLFILLKLQDFLK